MGRDVNEPELRVVTSVDPAFLPGSTRYFSYCYDKIAITKKLRKSLFLTRSVRPRPFRTGRSWFQEHKAVAHVANRGRKQRGRDASARLALSGVYYRTQPVEWRPP